MVNNEAPLSTPLAKVQNLNGEQEEARLKNSRRNLLQGKKETNKKFEVKNVRRGGRRRSKSPFEPKEVSLKAEKVVSAKEFEKILAFLRRRKLTAQDFVSLVKDFKALEGKYGKPYNEIIEDYKSKIDLISKANSALKEMENIRKDLESKISNLKDLLLLQDILARNRIPADVITQYILDYRRLGHFGFDVETMRLIVEELKRLEIDPKEAGNLVGSWLTKYKSINEALFLAQSELEKTKREEALSIARSKAFDLKADETQKKINALETFYTRRSERLESEYEVRKQVLEARVAEERSRTEGELFEILRDRDKMREENRLMKKELENSNEEIELAKSISTIIRDPKALTSSQIEKLVSEFMKVKEARERDEKKGPSSSSMSTYSPERLNKAREMILSILRDLPNIEKTHLG
jgi:hypothetical protein